MELMTIANRSILEHAISVSSPREGDAVFEGLNSMLDAISRGVLSEIWEEVVRTIRIGFELGFERARPVYDKTIARCQELLEEAGDAAATVKAALRDQLQTLLRDYIDGTLLIIRPSLRIGVTELQLQVVEVNHKIILGGDMSLSLERVFKFIAAGELSIAAKYGSTTA